MSKLDELAGALYGAKFLIAYEDSRVKEHGRTMLRLIERVDELERAKIDDIGLIGRLQRKLQSYRELADCVLEATIWTSGTRIYLGNSRWADIERLARELRDMDKGVK